MPASVIRTPRTRIGSDAAVSVQERWQNMRLRVQQEIPERYHQLRLTANLSCSEGAIDAMADALEKARYQRALADVPANWDAPAWQGARDEMPNLRLRYHKAWCDRREIRKKLHSSAVCHQILEDIPFDYNQDPPQIFGRDEIQPDHRSFAEEREAITRFLPQVLAIEAGAQPLSDAVANETCDDRKLVEALFRRLVKIEHRFDALKQENFNLREQLQHKQRKPKVRPARSRSSIQHEARTS
jgi:hypothetical protein